MKRFHLGINGGHQHARAVLLDSSEGASRILEVTHLDAINPHYLRDYDCVTRYKQAVAAIAQVVGFTPKAFVRETQSIVLSIAGAIPHAVEGKLNRQLAAAYCVPLTVVDDTWAGMFSATKKEAGLCAFSSVGASVAVALGEFSPEKKFKLDGWGPIIGDWGSAFQLVTEYFRNLGRIHDGDDACPLYEGLRRFTLEEHVDGPRILPLPESLDELQLWFDSIKRTYETDWHVRFAELATPILNSADCGNESAIDHVSAAANQLYDTISLAIGRFEGECSSLTLVLQGEMFESSTYLYSVLKRTEHLITNRLLFSVERAAYGPAFGALCIAMNQMDDSLDILMNARQTVSCHPNAMRCHFD